MNRNLLEYARFITKRELEDLIGQEMDGAALEERLVHAADDTSTFIYSAKAEAFVKNCWDDCKELDDGLVCGVNVLDDPEVYGVCTAQEAIRRLILESETMRELIWKGNVLITDELVDKLIEELNLKDYSLENGLDPEERMALDEFIPEITFNDYIREYISSHLHDLSGQEIYSADLGSALTEYDNANGSIFCSARKAEDFIKSYWNEAVETASVLRFEYAVSDEEFKEKYDPLTNPEAFQFCMVDEAVRKAIYACDYINEHNGYITLDDMTIAYIEKELGIQARIQSDILEMAEDDAKDNHYFLTNSGCVLEWAWEANAPEPISEADQQAYEMEEAYKPHLYDGSGNAIATGGTVYGRQIDAEEQGVIEFLGKYDNIRQCLDYNKERIEERAKEVCRKAHSSRRM